MRSPLALVAALLPLALASVARTPGMPNICHYDGRLCEWFGESPFCGLTRKRIGDMDDDGMELITWTIMDVSKNHLCSDHSKFVNPGPDCCSAYGPRCISGYKRLWCLPKK